MSKEIKFSKEIPEIFYRLNHVFHVEFKDIAIAYGDTIYCANDLPGYSIAHELVHIEQQERYGVWQWWDRYITDAKFRLDQEIPAYQAEVKYLYNHPEEISKEYRNKWIGHLVACLSGSMYGSMVSFQEAQKLLNIHERN